jgi:hypothetical protein
MDGHLEVEPAHLRDGGNRLGQIAERLQTEWSSFASGVKARGDIFGDDPIGGLIGASYQAAEQLAEGCYTSAATAFAGFGTGLSTMADQYEQVEQDNTDMFHAFGR